MKEEFSEQQAYDVLKALDKAIEAGPWDKSNFLEIIGKNLRAVRNSFANQLSLEKAKSTKDVIGHQASLRLDQQEVFVALYSSEGNNLQAWERVLANLPHQIVSRPIYAKEEDVKYLIKSKENKLNEAYVAIFINPKDILAIAADKTPEDKFGKPLLSLKSKTLNVENITRFVHLSGEYHYLRGRLIKI